MTPLGDNFPRSIRKRDGKVASFDLEKIKNAIFKAAQKVGGKDESKAHEVAIGVAEKLYTSFSVHNQIPTVDDSNNMCIQVLREKGFDITANTFESYAKDRSRVRDGIYVKKKKNSNNLTDQMLLVQSTTNETIEKWDRRKLEESIEKEYTTTPDLAKTIAKETENDVQRLRDTYGVSNFDTPFIRKISENHLEMWGIPIKNTSLTLPVSTLEALVVGNSKENSNITSNNPEAVNLGIAEYVLKQYNLRKVFSEEVAEAHNSGAVHIHDLGYPQRVYCSSHSIEYIKKYGLDKIVANLQNKSHPAKDAMVLSGHIQTFLASMQSRYAGALGFGFLNILYAPLLNAPTKVFEGNVGCKKAVLKRSTLEDMVESGLISSEDQNSMQEKLRLKKVSKKTMRQVAQNLVYSSSQNAFSRGGQTLFIDFNIHTGVPEYMKNVPVVGPGGKYMIEDSEGNIEMVDDAPRFMGKEGDSRNADVLQPTDGRKYVTYGDKRMVETAQDFAIELMKVWEAGDKYGVQFAFPKCDVHIGNSTLEDPAEREVFKQGCKLAAKNGSTYFMFDRDGAGATLAQCCRLKEKVTDMDLLKHPEKVRFTGFQNVTINLPQAAYKSKNTLEGTLENIDKAMEIAVKAHLQKKQYIQTLLDTDGSPMRSMGLPSDDGTNYINLEKSTYIMGLIGLNEAVQHLTGKQLHEDKDAYNMGLRIIDRMYQNVQRYKQDYKLKFTLEETPAESTTQKLAKGDLSRFKEAKNVIKGDHKKAPYYTNSIHLNPGANVSILDRIELQSKFHDMIESGSIIHVYAGEHQIPAESIEALVEKTFKNTRASQITISPEYTHCNDCHTNYNGFKDKCERDGSTNVTKRTKIVGYFSNLEGWNDSQLEISKAREKVANHYADTTPGSVPWLYEKDDSKKVMVFGKEGCQSCESAKSNLERLVKEMGLGVNVEFYDMTKQENRIAAAMYNVPFDPIPTVVTKNGSVRVYETKFKHGKPKHLDEKDYSAMLESFKH